MPMSICNTNYNVPREKGSVVKAQFITLKIDRIMVRIQKPSHGQVDREQRTAHKTFDFYNKKSPSILPLYVFLSDANTGSCFDFPD